MKTREEIEALKRNWAEDSCWDLEDTEGFEDHREELTAFRLQKEVEWKQQELQEYLAAQAEREANEDPEVQLDEAIEAIIAASHSLDLDQAQTEAQIAIARLMVVLIHKLEGVSEKLESLALVSIKKT